MSDRAQVFDHLIVIHADPGVRYGDRLVRFIGADADGEFSIRVKHIFVGEHLELSAVDGVGRIRDQFTQENLAIGV